MLRPCVFQPEKPYFQNLACVLAIIVIGSPLATALCSGQVENRNFALTIDRKAAGYYRMTIDTRAGGITQMSASANVSLKYLVYRYSYSLNESETWQDGRLVRLESSSNDNGKAFQVSAAADTKYLRISANGQLRIASLDAWTSTYWHLSNLGRQNAGVMVVVDADTGRVMRGTLQKVGNERVRCANVIQVCTHYRLPELQVDLWYDNQDRLAHEEYVEDGHRVVLELTQIW
jgi:hypothetical protein